MTDKVLYQSDILTVKYDEENKILFIILKIEFGQVDNETFFEEMAKTIPLLDQVEVKGVLFDLKDMAFPFTDEINDWLIKNLGYNFWIRHIKYFSYVYPQDYGAKLGFDLFYAEMMRREANMLKEAGKEELMKEQRRQFFDNFEQAYNWLKERVNA